MGVGQFCYTRGVWCALVVILDGSFKCILGLLRHFNLGYSFLVGDVSLYIRHSVFRFVVGKFFLLGHPFV